MKSLFERITELMKNRIFIMLGGIFILFAAISVRLFSLQIVNGEVYQQELKTSIMQDITIPASRGMIYDRYGRPLAVNEAAFSIKFDDSVTVPLANRSQSILDFVKSRGDSISDDLPITASYPRSFTFSSEDEETKWKQKAGLTKKQLKYSADETYEYLLEKYQVPSTLTDDEKRKFISLSISCSDKNLMILSLIDILDRFGETINDDLPISSTKPYEFLFDGNDTKETSWKKSVGMEEEQYSYNAEQTVEYLIDFFDIPSNLSDEIKRKAIAVRYSLYLMRYRKYQPITVAINIKDETVASIEENNGKFPGASIYTDSLREYPDGEYFSNIIGYIGKINDKEYETFKEYGYSQNDTIGKIGVENLYELQLRGEDGQSLVEVDASGRRINTIETQAPVSGNNVFLTIDKKLQIAAYNRLEEALAETLIRKLQAVSSKDSPISLKELFGSMVNSNNISIKKICTSTDGVSKFIYDLILSQHPDFDLSNDGASDTAKLVITAAIEDGTLSNRDMTVLLVEQGIITADDDYLNSIKSGAVTPLSVIIEKLRSRELHPYQTNLDPCSGSVVVSNVNTGEVLALVTYPSYDNNRFVNSFDSEYYSQLLNDPTTPLVNRPLKQKKAPGSTFKMITAVTGLETGVITPSGLIRDLGKFTKAGTPYPKCWIYPGGTHMNINVSHALEVSCNYFFYETAFRLGNSQEGTTRQAIDTLNEYMEGFGLNSPTGIEIEETDSRMASPEYKEETIKWQNPDATTSQTRWTDGDTIRAAIGQSVNNYTPAVMTKYIATLANGGTRYKYHVIDKVETSSGQVSEQKSPEIEQQMQISESTLQAVYDGMLLVTSGSKGTLRNIFRDFPVNVAAKSGTAQENLSRSSHTWFVGFAPYEDPQIAVTVMIPFGEASSSPAAVVGREIIGEYMGLNYTPENSYMDVELAQ
ncbi:hypothetical protein MUJ63_06205 [Lachnospiraceae bacterium NSJ-143]|nr:hypothetical protein [Lachnospiraceae bacterium NSJ-143]